MFDPTKLFKRAEEVEKKPLSEDPRPEEKGEAPRRAGRTTHLSDEEFCDQLTSVLEEVFKRAESGRLRSLRDLSRLAEELVARVEAGGSICSFPVEDYPPHQFIIPHSCNVAIMVAEVAPELGFDSSRIRLMVMAALVHHLGVVKVPEAVLTKSGPLTDQEFARLRRVPSDGAEILGNADQDGPGLSEIVHQVYERKDGTGYPRGLRAEEILTEAQVVGICCMFEAITHGRPYHGARDSVAGVSQILNMNGQAFRQEVVKAFLRKITPYPTGSWVKLSTGEVGQVIRLNDRNPLRPVVEVHLGTRGEQLEEPRVVDLAVLPHLYITEPTTPNS